MIIKYIPKAFFIIMAFIFCNSCSTIRDECKVIEIYNRWDKENGGIKYLKISDRKHVDYICNHLNSMVEKENVMVNYNYGYLEISINGNPQYVDMTFTVNHGILYRIGTGSFAEDSELSAYIMKSMNIKSDIWQQHN